MNEYLYQYMLGYDYSYDNNFEIKVEYFNRNIVGNDRKVDNCLSINVCLDLLKLQV